MAISSLLVEAIAILVLRQGEVCSTSQTPFLGRGRRLIDNVQAGWSTVAVNREAGGKSASRVGGDLRVKSAECPLSGVKRTCVMGALSQPCGTQNPKMTSGMKLDPGIFR